MAVEVIHKVGAGQVKLMNIGRRKILIFEEVSAQAHVEGSRPIVLFRPVLSLVESCV